MRRHARSWEIGSGVALLLTLSIVGGLWARREWLTRQMVAAIERRDFDRALHLARAGADGNAKLPDGDPALTHASSHGELVRELLARGADPVRSGPRGTAPLDAAVANYAPDAVEALLEAGAEPNRRDADGGTPLINLFADGPYNIDAETRASLVGAQDRILAALLRHGADVNFTSSRGESPLTYAVGRGERKHVEALLAAGADATAGIWYAVDTRQPELIRLLVRHGADLNKYPFRSRLLPQAVEQGDLETVRALIEAGADPTTGLETAVQERNGPLLQVLLASGADPKARSLSGRPLVELSRLLGFREGQRLFGKRLAAKRLGRPLTAKR